MIRLFENQLLLFALETLVEGKSNFVPSIGAVQRVNNAPKIDSLKIPFRLAFTFFMYIAQLRGRAKNFSGRYVTFLSDLHVFLVNLITHQYQVFSYPQT